MTQMRFRPFDPVVEKKARDEALERLSRVRKHLVEKANEVAIRIALGRGTVTSTEVFDEMFHMGHADAMNMVDPRWMGAVFRKGRGWIKVGYATQGSHGRPIPVWKRWSQ